MATNATISDQCRRSPAATCGCRSIAAGGAATAGTSLRRAAALASAALLLAAPGVHAADELRTTAADQQTVSLTVYNGDLALVRDARRLRLAAGELRLAFADVSAQIRPETARLYGGARVLEQSFDFDLLTPETLLEKYVGREVGLVRSHPTTGDERVERGTLLSVAGGSPVFRFGDRIETAGPNLPWRFVFQDVPADLRERPTLTMLLHSAEAADTDLELAYLTGGLSWQADYVATLAEGGEQMDLAGWVTLTNASGASYRDAQVQLLAGEVNLVRQVGPERMRAMAMAEPAVADVARESLFEYHLYTLARPTTVLDRQTKQVALLQAENIGLEREYRVDASGPFHGDYGDERRLPVLTVLAFHNEAPALGEPLPAGVLRFYQRDSAGRAQFIGESAIGHTAEGERVEAALGAAFDLSADARQTDYRRGYGEEHESAWEVELRSAKDVPVTVAITASFPGEWLVVDESAPHARVSAGSARWRLQVPAKGKATLSYRVRLR